MSKSKFPNQMDSSIEIPAVRDNIIEVGSDVINSLRSAIFQIEKTLGINPQGAAGNTVSKRLDKALDGNGNILKEALDRANLLSGPITNSNVSGVAAIAESKLKLDFPTNLLQDEISILDKQLESIILQIEELSVKLSSHIHPDAINRHKAKAISVDKIDKIDSTKGINSTEGGTAQEVFEEIFSSHINYDGNSTDSENNSHSASQIYFDNTNVMDKVKSLNAQDVIEEILNMDGGDIKEHQNLFHSNGLLRSVDSIGWTKTGEQLPIIGPVNISFSGSAAANSARFFNVFFEEPIDISKLEILKSDILEIDDVDFNFRFQIYETILENDLLSGLVIFGNLNIDSTIGTVGNIYKNRGQSAQLSSLLIGVRPDINHTSAETIQVADPRSTSVITYGLRPFEINDENRFINLKIDGGDAISIDLYDESLDNQSVDSIVNRINIQLLSSAHPALAYRAEMPYGGVEIAIVHNIPSSPDKDYSLMVEKGADDALSSSGFEYIKDVEVYSRTGSYFYVNGMTKVGLNRSMSRSDLFATDGTTFIESIELSLLNNNVLKNNLINVFKDNNVETYKIASLSDLQISVDINQLPDGFTGSDGISKFEIYENTISFESETFNEINSNFASAIFDIFIDSNGHLISNKRLSYEANYSVGAISSIAIVDFYGMATEDKYLYAKIIDTDTIEVSLGSGRPFRFKSFIGDGFYRELHDGIFSVKIYIDKFSSLYSYINDSNNIPDSGSISIPINIFSDVNREENFHIGRIHYESGIGRVSGAGSNMPRVTSSLNRGTTGFKDISSNAIYKLVNEPISDLRTSGVVMGLGVGRASDGEQLSNGLFKLDIGDGICYVAGKRMEISGGSNIVTNIDSAFVDKFYVAINHLGEFVFSSADAVTCGCLLDISNHCILGVVEWDNVNSSFIDLRLFVDNLDLKLLNSITVSPEPGMGHFDNLADALQYAKRFSEIFTGAGIPTIQMKSGEHVIEIDMKSPLYDDNGQLVQISQDELIFRNFDIGAIINFPVKIVGEGESTVLDIRRVWSDDTEDLRGSPLSEGPRPRRQEGVLYILGDGVSDPVRSRSISVLDDGFVEISNLKLRQCKVVAFGINTDKTIGNNNFKLNCGVLLDGLSFDYSDNKPNDPNGPNPGQMTIGSSVNIGGNNADQAVNKGNVYIKNCNFSFSRISFFNADPGALKNISIIDNKFSGAGLKEKTKYSGGAFEMMGVNQSDETIFDPAIGNYGQNNINIYGNINRSNPNDGIDEQHSRRWGDRVNKNLVVGNSIGIKYGFPDHELVIKGGANDAPPIIEMKTSDIAGEESKIIFTKVKNGATVVVGKMGFEDDGGGMFMRSGDGQTGLTINSLGVQTSERFYATAGFTIFSGAPKTFLNNETQFGGLAIFENDLVLSSEASLDPNVASKIIFSRDGQEDASIYKNFNGLNIFPGLLPISDTVRLHGSKLELNPGGFDDYAVEISGESNKISFLEESGLIEFNKVNSGITIRGDDSAINLLGLRNKLQTFGRDCQINLNGVDNEININGLGDNAINLDAPSCRINFTTGGGSGLYLDGGARIQIEQGALNVFQGSSADFNAGSFLEVNHDPAQPGIFGFILKNVPSCGGFIGDCEALAVHSLGGATGVVGINNGALSSRAIKRDIIDLDVGLEEINRMRPVSYILKVDKSERVNIGMIVEDLAEIDNRMVRMGPKVSVEGESIIKDDDRENPVPYKWEAREIVPVLVRAIQELSQKVKDLEEKVDA